MNPPAICPVCKKVREFHDEEMEQVDDGSAACPDCRLKITEAAFIDAIARGEIPAPPEMLEDAPHSHLEEE